MSSTCRVVTVMLFTLAAAGAAAQTLPQPDALTAVQVAVACAPPPTLAMASAETPQIIGSQDPMPRGLFGMPELLVVNAGTNQGVSLGQQYFARRLVRHGTAYGDNKLAHSVLTSGWIRVVAANETTALASVDHACGEIRSGDYLEPFQAPAVPADITAVDTSVEPDFSDIGRVLFGYEERRTAGLGEYMLIDRGQEQGVSLGAHFAIYRDVQTGYFGQPRYVRQPGLTDDRPLSGLPLVAVGEALVVSVGKRLSLVRINRARDAIFSGDFVVPRGK